MALLQAVVEIGQAAGPVVSAAVHATQAAVHVAQAAAPVAVEVGKGMLSAAQFSGHLTAAIVRDPFNPLNPFAYNNWGTGGGSSSPKSSNESDPYAAYRKSLENPGTVVSLNNGQKLITPKLESMSGKQLKDEYTMNLEVINNLIESRKQLGTSRGKTLPNHEQKVTAVDKTIQAYINRTQALIKRCEELSNSVHLNQALQPQNALSKATTDGDITIKEQRQWLQKRHELAKQVVRDYSQNFMLIKKNLESVSPQLASNLQAIKIVSPPAPQAQLLSTVNKGLAQQQRQFINHAIPPAKNLAAMQHRYETSQKLATGNHLETEKRISPSVIENFKQKILPKFEGCKAYMTNDGRLAIAGPAVKACQAAKELAKVHPTSFKISGTNPEKVAEMVKYAKENKIDISKITLKVGEKK